MYKRQDYDRFRGKNVTLNVYNWGEYISDGADDTMDVIQEFEDLTGITVNYTTFDLSLIHISCRSPPSARPSRWSCPGPCPP